MAFQLLFSYTVLAGLLLLVGIAAASYAGTTVALRRFFGHEHPRPGGRRGAVTALRRRR